jgi:AAA+ superfamily predicted ATPase
MSEAGYPTRQAWIEDHLFAARMRIRAAAEQLQHWTTGHISDLPSELAEQEAQIAARVRASDELPLVQLCERFDLTADEQRVLWILIAHSLCPIARNLLRNLSTEDALEPTTDVVQRVVLGIRFGEELLDPDGPLVRFGLVERTDREAHAPEHRQTWKVSRRVLALVRGHLELDRSLAQVAVIENIPPALDELELESDAKTAIAAAFDCGDLVVVHGRVGSGRRSSLVATAHARGLRVLRVDGRELARDRDATRHQLRAIARECRLLGLTPLICNLDALCAAGEVADRIDLVEQELLGLVLATSKLAIARRWRRSPIAIELRPLPLASLITLWGRALPGHAGSGDLHHLATTYPMAPSLISAVGRIAMDRCGDSAMSEHHVRSALRAVLDDRLAGLATRVDVTQTWDDIVLPDEQATSMCELIARIGARAQVYETWGFAEKLGKGLGVHALFSGPPGTGKTMAAGLLARAVGLELYQVDTSKIVSKWIGETEQHLAALFDAAEAGHAILLFDEADALFGKRSQVRSSTDRYANQETNYLLQRLESYAGICFLTSNHESAIDDAFRRRLAVHVRFPMPDQDERVRIWRALIPTRAPRAHEIDFDKLASTYAMSGGHIRNAVLRAAFLAADEVGVIDTSRLTRAAQLEFETLGKVIASHS